MPVPLYWALSSCPSSTCLIQTPQSTKTYVSTPPHAENRIWYIARAHIHLLSEQIWESTDLHQAPVEYSRKSVECFIYSTPLNLFVQNIKKKEKSNV